MARIPQMKLHKGTGQARVILAGRHIYLGKWGSAEAHHQYAELLKSLADNDVAPSRAPAPIEATVRHLTVGFCRYAQEHYETRSSDGRMWIVRKACRMLDDLYGDDPVNSVGPIKLEALRDVLIHRGLARKTINDIVSQIVTAFRWGVRKELVRPDVLAALRAVPSLSKGESGVKETSPVKVVDAITIGRTLRMLPRQVADMVRVQLRTGARPGEIRMMRVGDIVADRDTWLFIPEHHKTEHLGKVRQIPVGPRTRRVLTPHREGKRSEQYVFTTGIGDNVPYTKDSYAKAVKRAAKRAGVPHWSPNQLRHTRGSEIRRRYGVEAASTVLGHSNLQTTEIYAERNLAMAERIMQETG